jgi:excisionase family DNA binding protein
VSFPWLTVDLAAIGAMAKHHRGRGKPNWSMARRSGDHRVRRMEVVIVTDQGELITVQAAADRLAVSRWMIYRLIWEQQVKSVQIGRCRRIIRQSLDEYVAGLIDGVA